MPEDNNSQAVAEQSPAAEVVNSSIESEISRFNFGDVKVADKVEDKSTEQVVEDKSEVKVEENKTPETKTVKLSDFNKILPSTKKLVQEFKEGEKKEEEDKVENKDTTTKLDDGTNKIKNSPPSRDLTGFTEDEAKLLKQMSNESFNYVSKVIKEHKGHSEVVKQYEEKIKNLSEGKVQLPESYYENPNAGWLQPEVQEIQANLNLASQIEAHWKQQLINVEAGKEWYDLIEGKDGQIFVSNKPTPAGTPGEMDWATNKQNISQYFQQAINQTGQIRGQLNGLVTSFQTKHKELVGKIKTAESKFMPMFDDEKSEEFKALEPIKAELTKFGIAKDNPIFGMLVKSVALNMILRDAYLSEKNKKDTGKIVQEQQRRAGPTQAAFNGAAPSDNGKVTPSLADFAKLGLKRISV